MRSSSTPSGRPIGRAMKGSLQGRPRRRPRRGPAARARRAQPGGRLRRDERHHDGLRLPGRASRATTSAATRSCWPGIDHHVPAVTVSRFCASSLQTIRMAFHAIKAGEGDQYIAAGVECVSRGAAQTFPLTNPRIDGSERHAATTSTSRWASRPRTSPSAARSAASPRTSGRRISQQRAVAARDSGHFDREIVGVDIPELHDAGGDVVAAHTVTRDDGPRPGTTVEKLAAAQAGLQAGRHGDRRQRVPAQRRRRGRAGDVRGEGPRRWA